MNWLLLGIGWLAGYCLLFVYVTVFKSPPRGFSFSGPLVKWESQKGLGVLQQIASVRRFWRAWGLAGVVLSFVGVAVGLLTVSFSLFVLLTVGSSRTLEDPANVLVIPGVNDFLPLAAAPEIVLGLLIGMVIHEGGHAIMCYISDIDVESTGLFFFLGIPLGAFVEPDEESQVRSSRIERLQMFAGGIMNNVMFTVLALALLFGPIAGAIAVAPGAPIAGVLADTPAADAGLDRGDRVTMVDNTPVDDASALEDALAASESRTVTLTVNGESEVEMTQEVVVTRATDDAVFEPGTSITAVNGESVWTEEQFYSALRDGDSATLTSDTGKTVTVEAGVTVELQEDTWAQDGGALTKTGMPTGKPVMITHVDGTPVYTANGLVEQLEEAATRPEQTVTVVHNGVAREYTVSITPDEKYGIRTGAGKASIEATDFGAQYYPSKSYLNVLNGGGNAMSLWQSVVMLLYLPLSSLAPNVVTDFPGFIPEIQNFYTVTGAAGGITGVWFFLASALYWGAWVNMNLALFNCIPTYALDGGHILRDTVDEVLARVPGGEPEGTVAKVIKRSVLTGTLAVLVLLFGSLFI